MRKVNKLVNRGELRTLQITCPEELKEYINTNECSVEREVSGGYVVVDWSLQCSVAAALTKKECYDFIRNY